MEACVKKPTTFKEQVEILKSRGLIINDEKRAEYILSNINYYRLTAYLLSYKRKDNSFKHGISIEEIHQIYTFDKRLRTLLLGVLESVEISFRTYIAYTLAHRYGSLGYKESRNFKEEEYHNRFMEELEIEKRKNRNEPCIKHHEEKYGGELPIWVATEIMTFGMVSKLFSNLRTEDKTEIRQRFCEVPSNLVSNWLAALSHIRNICAHYGRLYNKKFKFKVSIHYGDRKYNLENDKLFINILCIRYLLDNDKEWKSFLSSLVALIEEYDKVDLSLIGFPPNWLSILSE